MSDSSSGGLGFFGFLTLIFITLKITNFIEWSWWWVLAPLWAPVVLVIVIVVVGIGWSNVGTKNKKEK